MSTRKQNAILLVVVSFCIALSGNAAFAQTPAELAAAEAALAEKEAAAQRAAVEVEKRERERLDRAMKEFLTDSREVISTANNASEKRRQLLLGREYDQIWEAYLGFQIGRADLYEALRRKTKLKDPAKKIQNSAEVFLNFLKRRNSQRQRFEESEFAGVSAATLSREVLATTERLAPQLAAVIRNEDEATVDVQFLTSLSKLETELLRLKWMLGKLK